jgi:hypothetical protein
VGVTGTMLGAGTAGEMGGGRVPYGDGEEMEVVLAVGGCPKPYEEEAGAGEAGAKEKEGFVAGKEDAGPKREGAVVAKRLVAKQRDMYLKWGQG